MNVVEILVRYSCRPAVFTLFTRKTRSIKLIQSGRTLLYLQVR
jgi:hypothetical protein